MALSATFNSGLHTCGAEARTPMPGARLPGWTRAPQQPWLHVVYRPPSAPALKLPRCRQPWSSRTFAAASGVGHWVEKLPLPGAVGPCPTSGTQGTCSVIVSSPATLCPSRGVCLKSRASIITAAKNLLWLPWPPGIHTVYSSILKNAPSRASPEILILSGWEWESELHSASAAT